MLPFPCHFTDVLFQLLVLQSLCTQGSGRDVSVVVALDEVGAQLLADDAYATNKHSLRSLWAEHDDFWDIQMQHECPDSGGQCVFSSNLSSLPSSDAVLFSAQMFPGMGRFEEIMLGLSPHQATILWNTEAVDTFRLGPQLPVLEAKLDFTASYEMHSDVPLLQGFPTWLSPDHFAQHSDWQSPRAGGIAWIASNCDTTTNGRTAFVQELMRFVQVDSFGKCLHNKELPLHMTNQRAHGRKFWEDKVRLLEDYSFTLGLRSLACVCACPHLHAACRVGSPKP